jgi:hypothetical protein
VSAKIKMTFVRSKKPYRSSTRVLREVYGRPWTHRSVPVKNMRNRLS